MQGGLLLSHSSVDADLNDGSAALCAHQQHCELEAPALRLQLLVGHSRCSEGQKTLECVTLEPGPRLAKGRGLQKEGNTGSPAGREQSNSTTSVQHTPPKLGVSQGEGSFSRLLRRNDDS